MIDITINEIAHAISAQIFGTGNTDACVGSITIDSRQVKPNGVFIALKGERFDGHDFVGGAQMAGCTAAIVEHTVPVSDSDFIQLKVESTFAAVGALGAYIREKSNVFVVGITGSVGKTSTKELTAAVLSQSFNVLKTDGNFNNELGLPRTLFGLEPYIDVAVLEMGISHFGEMSRLSAIAKPDAAVIINIENVHTEHLIDRDGVLSAKTEIVSSMRGRILILNGDDDKLRAYIPPKGFKRIYYGLSDGCDVTARDIIQTDIEHTRFTLMVNGCNTTVDLPSSGNHMVLNALAAAAVGDAVGLDVQSIARGIANYSTVGSRMRIIRTGSATIIDDCYNASPASVLAALNVLSNSKGRKLALLGDMLELGQNTEELHRQAGAEAARLGVSVLFTLGERGKDIAAGAEENGVRDVRRIEREHAAEIILNELHEGDTLLIKASHGMHLEGIARQIADGIETDR